GRITVDGPENAVQAQPVFHGGAELGQKVTRVFADDDRAEDAVTPGNGQDLDEAVGAAVGNGAVEIVDAIARDLVGDAPLARFGLAQPDAGDFGVGEGGPGDHAVIGPEPAEHAEKRVDGGEPGLVRGRVGELVGAG